MAPAATVRHGYAQAVHLPGVVLRPLRHAMAQPGLADQLDGLQQGRRYVLQ